MSIPAQSGFDMPPRFLAGENLESDIVQGSRRKRPNMTFLTAHEANTIRLKDPGLLKRAKELDLILISHDSRTMYDHFAAFLLGLPQGEHCPGVFLVSDTYGVGQIIDFVVEIYDLSSHGEWRDRIVRLPL
jgi:hypothetical protein